MLNTVTELVLYLLSFLHSKQGTCDITIVRRYNSGCGYNGEVYIDGRYYGVSCDRFLDGQEIFKHSLRIGYESGHRVLRTDTYVLTQGDFTARVDANVCLIGSAEQHLNETALRDLIDTIQNKQYLRLTVLNRLLQEI